MTGVGAAWHRIGLLVLALFPLGCGTQAPVDPALPHHTAGGFRNVHDDYQPPGFGAFLHWQWNRFWQHIPGPERYDFPLAENSPAPLRENRSRTSVTWIGHATVLLQVNGINILTDPLFFERASPVSWAGPRRAVPPGIALEELPPIDVVVISHDHYDALDAYTVRALAAGPGAERIQFLVPLGLRAWFEAQGIERVRELDWWETHRVGELRVMAVPVQHWSKRRLLGRNKTLWAGWAVLAPEFRFLFAGDSGYTPHFAEIGDRLGPFDLAAIPIGAYAPREFMRAHHIDPEEAVQVHQDLRSQRSVAIHWGTFVLSDEPLDEPPRRLSAARAAAGLPEDAFQVLQHGETLWLDGGTP